jgi:hypothetical protein
MDFASDKSTRIEPVVLSWGAVEFRKTPTVETDKQKRKRVCNLDIVSFEVEVCVSMAAASVSLPTARRCR